MDRAALEVDGSPGHGDQSNGRPRKRGLAATGLTDEADNLAATGYDADAVAALLAAAGLTDERDLDVAPDLPAEADLYVRPGDLWMLGDHRLLGLDERAEIVRDTYGVPHIFAGTAHDPR